MIKPFDIHVEHVEGRPIAWVNDDKAIMEPPARLKDIKVGNALDHHIFGVDHHHARWIVLRKVVGDHRLKELRLPAS